MKKVLLTTAHIQESLSRPILIGSDEAADGKKKQFLFAPWANEYRVMHNHVQVDGGQAIEELLDAYNEL